VDLDALAGIGSGKISQQQASLLDPTVLQSWRRCTLRLIPQASSHATITVDDIYGESSAMRQTRIAARGLAPVLLSGEGGVGKVHVAQAIHNDSLRASKPF